MAVKKWLDEYQTIFWETALISQVATFSVSLFSLLSLYSLLIASYDVPEYVKDHQEIFLIAISFHLLVAVVFGVRFTLLFFNTKKSFWLSQLVWIISLLTLFAWSAYTKDSLQGFFYVVPERRSLCFDCEETSVFFLAPAFWSIWAFSIFSPVRSGRFLRSQSQYLSDGKSYFYKALQIAFDLNVKFNFNR